MPWRGEYRLACKVCKRPRAEGEMFSVRGKCPDCGAALSEQNALELHEHRGHYFDHWRRRSLAALGGAPLDDVRTEP